MKVLKVIVKQKKLSLPVGFLPTLPVTFQISSVRDHVARQDKIF